MPIPLPSNLSAAQQRILNEASIVKETGRDLDVSYRGQTYKVRPMANQETGFAVLDALSGNVGAQRAVNPEVQNLLTSGQYRDIPAGTPLTAEAIKATPVFNPNIGPQINYGTAPIEGRVLGSQVDVSKQLSVPDYPAVPIVTPASETLEQFKARLTKGGATPTPTPAPLASLPAPTATPQFAETPGERSVQALIERLQGLTTRQVAEPGRRLAEEQAAGLPGLETTQRDLQNQLNALQGEARAIPLSSAGPGQTAPMLGAQQRELLTQNAIKTLGVAAALDATQGLLASAKDKVDRAIRAEFGPIEAEIQALTNNVNLILKSPDYTRAEKNQALQIELLQNQRKEAVADAKAEKAEIYKTYLDVAKTGLAPADVLEQIRSSSDKFSAVELAAPYLGADDTQVVDVGGRKKLINTKTGETVKDLGVSSVAAKPATQAQQTVAGYTARIEQANPTLKNLEGAISGMNIVSYEAQRRLPSALQSANMQQYMQAARNFINAVLRRESGAVISPTEFSDARQQYLPSPGDTADTLIQKELTRRIVYENFKKSAGTAYTSVDELLGGITGVGEEEVYVTPEGVEYVKGEDGLYYPR